MDVRKISGKGFMEMYSPRQFPELDTPPPLWEDSGEGWAKCLKCGMEWDSAHTCAKFEEGKGDY